MITEHGRITSIDGQRLRIETIPKSTCGSCEAKQGCGTGLLEKYLASTRYFEVDLQYRSGTDFIEGDLVELGVDESVVIRGSALVYILPLIGLMLGAWFGHVQFGELASVVLAALGMLLAGILIHVHSLYHRFNPKYQPVILEDDQIIRIS